MSSCKKKVILKDAEYSSIRKKTTSWVCESERPGKIPENVLHCKCEKAVATLVNLLCAKQVIYELYVSRDCLLHHGQAMFARRLITVNYRRKIILIMKGKTAYTHMYRESLHEMGTLAA